MRNFAKTWLPVIAWMCLIFLGSTDQGSAGHTGGFIAPFLHWLFPHASQKRIDFLHFMIRKCAHLTEYAVLAILAFRALTHGDYVPPGKNRWKISGIALAAAAIYAASDEFHQRFVPSRGASFDDVLLDTCGAFFGIAGLLIWRKRDDKKES